MTGVGRTCVCAHGVWRLLCRPYKTAAPLGVGADVPIGPRGPADLPPSRGKVAFAEQMTDEGGYWAWLCAPATPSVACGDSSPVKGELYFVGRGLPDAPHSKRNTTPKRRAGEDTGPYNTTVTLA